MPQKKKQKKKQLSQYGRAAVEACLSGESVPSPPGACDKPTQESLDKIQLQRLIELLFGLQLTPGETKLLWRGSSPGLNTVAPN